MTSDERAWIKRCIAWFLCGEMACFGVELSTARWMCWRTIAEANDIGKWEAT